MNEYTHSHAPACDSPHLTPPTLSRWNRLSNEVCATLAETFTLEVKTRVLAASRDWTLMNQVTELFNLEEEEEEHYELLV